MIPALLVLLPTLSEGPLARVELAMDRRPGADPPLLEAMVEGVGARLRADPRVLDGGLRVEAGCNRTRCQLTLDGLAPGVNAALPALAEALAGPPVEVRCATRRTLKRQWRGSFRVPSRLLEAGLDRLDGTGLPGAGPRPRFRARDLRRAWEAVAAPEAWSEIAAAGAFDEAAVRDLAARFGAASPRPAPAAPEPTPSPLGLTVVDWPGASRAQVAVAWAHGPEDAVRERLLAGDFESRLVQRLREADTLTYDVTPEGGEGWAGASFDVATDSVAAAILAARSELAHVGDLDATAIAGATLRLQAAVAELDDTLAGRLALRQLPAAPAVAPGALRPVELLGIVVVGDAEALLGPLGAAAPDLPLAVVDRCRLMYGHACPDGG